MLQRPGHVDVSVRNPRGVIYGEGDENTDGSLRFADYLGAGDTEILQKRVGGSWELAALRAANFFGEFGDLVSEQNPDAVNAIRVKATGSDVDVVIGDASGYFSVWNAADNNAVFYVDNAGNTVISGYLDMNSNQINELTDPTLDQDAATKKYVDDQFPVTHASTTGRTTDDHHAETHTIVSHDTTATGAELDTLTDNSIVDTLHRHSELSASDGTPDPALSVDAAGNVLIGTGSPTVPLDIIRSSPQIRIGSSLTNSVSKQGKIVLPHFTIAEEDVMGIFIISDTDSNDVVLGGGSSSQNSATVIRFMTGVNQTTISGTERMRIDNIGVGMGTIIPQRDLHIESSVPTIRLSDSNAATDQEVATLIEFYRGNQANRVGYLGMASAGNDDLRLATDYPAGLITLRTGNSVTALTIDNSQRVGIRETSPDYPLHVTSSEEIQAQFESTDTISDILIKDSSSYIRLRNNEGEFQLLTDGDTKTPIATLNGRVGIGTTSPATSALLELLSTIGALLLPRMTTTQRNALTALEGMIIYNTTTSNFEGYNWTGWATLS